MGVLGVYGGKGTVAEIFERQLLLDMESRGARRIVDYIFYRNLFEKAAIERMIKFLSRLAFNKVLETGKFTLPGIVKIDTYMRKGCKKKYSLLVDGVKVTTRARPAMKTVRTTVHTDLKRKIKARS